VNLRAQTALAGRIRSAREELARAVNDEFFRRHPEWHQRYGPRGVEHGYEDACFHLDFLAAALEAGSPEAFAQYVLWARRMLEARGIAAAFLAENIGQVVEAAAAQAGADAAQRLAPYLDGALAVCSTPMPAAPQPEARVGIFVQALLSGQRAAALNLAREFVRQGMSVRDVYLRVLQPAMYEIGRLWESNQISVAREHMATAITQYVLGQLYPLLMEASVAAPRGAAVIAGVQGEFHQGGAHMVADVLESDGWQVRFLGSNLPHSGILAALEESRATLFGVSATMLFSMPKAAQLVGAARQRFPGLGVLVGGAAFRHSPGLWQEIGAHGYASDLQEALQAAARIAGDGDCS
jgi:methanogenic corrinoid protein MtbC1